MGKSYRSRRVKKRDGVEVITEERPTAPIKPRQKRRNDPLKKKSKKLARVKNLNDIELNKKESKGSDLIQRLNNIKDISIHSTNITSADSSPDSSSAKYLGNTEEGIEVVDVKNISNKKKP